MIGIFSPAVEYAVLSDTHSDDGEELREAIEFVELSNAEFAVHTGDIVDGYGDGLSTAGEIIDSADIPVFACPGNHDSPWLNPRDTSTFESEIGPPNHSVLFNTPIGELQLFTTEFAPRDETMDWVEREMSRPDSIIFTTHSFLYHDGERARAGSDHSPTEYRIDSGNTGKQLWERWLSDWGQLRVVHSGHHITGPCAADRQDANVVQCFHNYQTEDRPVVRLVALYRRAVAMRDVDASTGELLYTTKYRNPYL
jgi:hypothetical protein